MSHIGPRREKISPGQVMSDCQTDGQTDHYRVPAERGTNSVKEQFTFECFSPFKFMRL